MNQLTVSKWATASHCHCINVHILHCLSIKNLWNGSGVIKLTEEAQELSRVMVENFFAHVSSLVDVTVTSEWWILTFNFKESLLSEQFKLPHVRYLETVLIYSSV